ncbi:MAG: hypothetical protein Kow00120_00130 [Anaerolineae bacterium]
MPDESIISRTQSPEWADLSEAGAVARRIVTTKNVIRIGAVLAVISIGTYLLFYIQTGAWQALACIVGMILGILCMIPGYRLAGRGRFEAAGYWLVFAIMVIYGAGEMFWSDATLPLTISVALLMSLLGTVIRPRWWGVWVAIFGVYLVYVFVVNQFEPLPRHPLLEISPGMPLINVPLALLVAWQVIRLVIQDTIRTRLTITFAAMALLPTVIVGVSLIVIYAHEFEARAQSQLETLASFKHAEISTWVDRLHTDLAAIVESAAVEWYLRTLIQEDALPTAYAVAQEGFRKELVRSIELTGRFDGLFLMDRDGKVVVSTDPAQEGAIFQDERFFVGGLEAPSIHSVVDSEILPEDLFIVTRPLTDLNGQPIGVLAGRANLTALNAVMLQRAGMGDTGETYLVDANHFLLTPLRFGEHVVGETTVQTQAVDTAISDRAAGFAQYEDYRGTPVVGAYRWLPELQVALVVEQDQAEAISTAGTTIAIALAGASVIVALIASAFVSQGIAGPLIDLARTATHVAGGDLNLTAEVKRADEVGALAQAFNRMTAQLRDLIGNLEARVAERTHDLETVAELGRAVTRLRDLNTLLPLAVDFIQQQTGHYHVQVFILDEAGEYALLRASTGVAGKRLLDAGHRLAVGSESVIGQVTKRGQPVIALDTANAQVPHQPNPMLPDTRSEMALPLRIEGRVFGALDVQSTAPDAFNEDDVRVFQLLADQLAVAIDSATTLHELRVRLQEIDALNRRMVGEAWTEYLRRRYQAGVGAVSDERAVIQQAEMTDRMAEAIRRQEAVVTPAAGSQVVALPVTYRGTALGALEFEVEGDTVDSETLGLAQTLVDRLALSLDNVRLTERSQRMAQRERIVNEISGKLTGMTDMAEILQTTVRELGQALRVPETSIHLAPVPGHDGDSGNGAEA